MLGGDIVGQNESFLTLDFDFLSGRKVLQRDDRVVSGMNPQARSEIGRHTQDTLLNLRDFIADLFNESQSDARATRLPL